MQINKILDAVVNIQKINTNILLCGSAALMIADIMPQRVPGDIDFALNQRDFANIVGVSNISIDRYPINKGDNYKSYHGTYRPQAFARSVSVNLLVFTDDIELNSETIICRGTSINIQKVDDILYWKQKYNRPKDIEDLSKITTKAIEEILLS